MSQNNAQLRAEAEGMTLPELATAINDFEGAAFWLEHDAADGRIPDEGVDEGVEDLYETVAVYGTGFATGAEMVVLARIRDGGIFTLIFSNDAARITLTSFAPQYRNDPGFRRALSGWDFPGDIRNVDIRRPGTIFCYDGADEDPRRGVWETFHVFRRPTGDGDTVVIARAHGRPMIAEFTGGYLASISIAPAEFRGYVERHVHGVTIPAMDITNPW